MRLYRLATVTIGCVLLATFGSTISRSLAATPITISPILKEWKLRSERIASAKFTMSVQQTDNKGSIRIIGIDKPFPDKDTTLSYTESVLWDGTRMRYIFDGESWNGITKGTQILKCDCVFDGTRVVHLHSPVTPLTYPEAAYMDRKTIAFQTFRHQRPLLAYLRPFTLGFGNFNVDELTIDTSRTDGKLVALTMTSATPTLLGGPRLRVLNWKND